MSTDTTFQERKFRAAFGLFDTDKNGVIGWPNLLSFADRLRQAAGWTKQDPRFAKVVEDLKVSWNQILKNQDKDQSGTLSYEECLGFAFRFGIEWMTNGALPAWAQKSVDALGQIIDLNGDGVYTVKEYAVYLRAIGSDADPATAFAKIDLNKNGKLTLNEGVTLLKQFALSTDPASPGNFLLTGKLI